MTESPAPLTPKREKFAQKFIETGSASEAYRLSFDASRMKDKTIWETASKLLKDPKVAARVAELQAAHQKRHDVTVDSITAELEEARMIALADKQASAAVSASLGKAKLHGLVVDKNELTGPNGGPVKTDGTVQIYLPDNGRSTPNKK